MSTNPSRNDFSDELDFARLELAYAKLDPQWFGCFLLVLAILEEDDDQIAA
jgi:hypothetical protein